MPASLALSLVVVPGRAWADPGITTEDLAGALTLADLVGSPVISFRYVFASEEYNEYVNSSYNNVFGFFLNGTNIALLPDGVTPVSINNVNGGNPLGVNASDSDYYRNNDLSDGGPFFDVEADGLTVVLGAEAAIDPGVNHFKIGAADAGDSVLDSWVFLEADSFRCAPLAPPSVGGFAAGVIGPEGTAALREPAAAESPWRLALAGVLAALALGVAAPAILR